MCQTLMRFGPVWLPHWPGYAVTLHVTANLLEFLGGSGDSHE